MIHIRLPFFPVPGQGWQPAAGAHRVRRLARVAAAPQRLHLPAQRAGLLVPLLQRALQLIAAVLQRLLLLVQLGYLCAGSQTRRQLAQRLA